MHVDSKRISMWLAASILLAVTPLIQAQGDRIPDSVQSGKNGARAETMIQETQQGSHDPKQKKGHEKGHDKNHDQDHAKDGHAKDGHAKDSHNGEHGHHEDHEHAHEEPSDLNVWNFFTEGWDEKFEERHRKDNAPRFNLFKSRQGFLEKIVFVNYAHTTGLEEDRLREHELAGGIELPLNRRFQIGIEAFYTWQRRTGEEDRRNSDGLRWDFSTRLQLIDTKDSAYNFQVHLVTPNRNIDAEQTELSFVLAGFEDLTRTCGLHRVGLYYDVEYATRFGPRGPDDDRRPANLLRYDVSLAKTLTEPDAPLFADFTVFLEAFGETQLDGANRGRTLFSLTPGLRFNPTGREENAWWIQVGIEVPVNGPRAFNERVLLSLIHDF